MATSVGTAAAGVGRGCWGLLSSTAQAGGARGEGWESHCAGPLRELFHVRLAGGLNSSAGGNSEPYLRQRIIASHLCEPKHAED